MNSVARSIIGIALTAGAVYLLDPQSGRRRRLMLRDQCARAARRVELGTRDARHNAGERAHVIAERTRAAFAGNPASDKAVSKKACACVREMVEHPEQIEMAVEDGHVILRGVVAPREHQALLDALRTTPGVRVVTDHLHETHEPIVHLQSAVDADRHFRAVTVPASGWSVAGRVLAGCAGTALVVWGVRERKALGEFGASVGRTIARISKEELARLSAAAEEAMEGAEGIAERTGEAIPEAAAAVQATAQEKVEEWADSARERKAQSRRRQTEPDGQSALQ